MLHHDRRAALLLFLALTTACGTPLPPDATPTFVAAEKRAPEPVPAWTSEAPLLFARAAHAVVSTGTALYALAGTGSTGAPVLPVERFDGATWTVETTLPGDGLNAPAAAVLDDRIYVIGGFTTTTNIPTGAVLVYDLRTHAWSEAAPLPNPRGGHAAAVLNGRIYIVGGGNSESTLADHSVYDPLTNTWTELAPLTVSKGSPALVVSAGALWVIGGRSGSSDFGDVQRYDAAINTWITGPSIDPRGAAGATLLCDAIHVFGGESQLRSSVLGEAFRLDPVTEVWAAIPPMPTARVYARAVPFANSVYVVGGSPTPVRSHRSIGLSTVERYQAACVPSPLVPSPAPEA